MVIKTAADCNKAFKTYTEELFSMAIMELIGEVINLVLNILSIPVNLVPFGHYLAKNLKPEFAEALAHISSGIAISSTVNAACTNFTLDGKSATDQLRTIGAY